jgi:hypothetical protein
MGDSSLRATITCDLYGRFIDRFLVTFLLFFDKKFSREKIKRREKFEGENFGRKNFKKQTLKHEEKIFTFKTKKTQIKFFLHPKQKEKIR